jgi:hypothetical protein
MELGTDPACKDLLGLAAGDLRHSKLKLARF